MRFEIGHRAKTLNQRDGATGNVFALQSGLWDHVGKHGWITAKGFAGWTRWARICRAVSCTNLCWRPTTNCLRRRVELVLESEMVMQPQLDALRIIAFAVFRSRTAAIQIKAGAQSPAAMVAVE